MFKQNADAFKHQKGKTRTACLTKGLVCLARGPEAALSTYISCRDHALEMGEARLGVQIKYGRHLKEPTDWPVKSRQTARSQPREGSSVQGPMVPQKGLATFLGSPVPVTGSLISFQLIGNIMLPASLRAMTTPRSLRAVVM